MEEWKDMHPSPPVRTLKSQLAAEQPSIGNCWIWLKYGTSCSRVKRKPQQDGRRGTITFRIKPHTFQRRWEGANKTVCAPGPRERSSDLHKTLSHLPLVSEHLLWRQRSAVICCGVRGTDYNCPGTTECWQKSFWKRSPLPPLTLPQFGLRPNWVLLWEVRPFSVNL